MIQRALVVGGGSAGFLSAIALKHRFPELGVTVILSRELGVIGVGEGTTGFFPSYIHARLGMDPAEFHRLAQPTWKLGIRFENWGPRPYFNYTFRSQVTSRYVKLPKPTGYYCYDDFEHLDISSAMMSHDKVFLRNADGTPVLDSSAAYHIENRQFVGFLEGYASRLGVGVIDDIVQEVRQDDGGVSSLLLKSGNVVDTDLYVDCSGFTSLLLDKTLKEPFISFKSTLFNDRAVVGGWNRTTEMIKPYTVAEAMNAGWCWQIDHEFLANRGYVYSSAFISDEEAEREFRTKNPKIDDTRIVKFITGRHERAWVKNVVAIGNACGFVEPLEATSLAAICDESDSLVRTLADCDFEPTPSILSQFNRRIAARWDDIRQFLGIHYKFNTAFDNAYWRECREKADLRGAAEVVEYFRENGPSLAHRDTLLHPLSQFGLEGYWTLLIGERAPWQNPYTPSRSECCTLYQIQESMKAKALSALDTFEVFAAIRSPEYQWPANFFVDERFQIPV